MRRVIIESPYAGEINENMFYLRKCLRDSINRGEAPIASHLIYPYVLREELQSERQLGIELGYSWWAAAEAICFYADRGWSAGMLAALARAMQHGYCIEVRNLEPASTREEPKQSAENSAEGEPSCEQKPAK